MGWGFLLFTRQVRKWALIGYFKCLYINRVWLGGYVI